MKPRPTDGDDDGGLDSLLDTMTNVVGILVLVLIVTQLGVTEKVSELTANSEITEDDVTLAKLDLDEKLAEQKLLADELKSATAIDVNAEKERLARLKEMLATRKKLLADQQKQANEFSMTIESDRKKAASAKKEIADNKQQRETLSKSISEKLARKAELDALLEKTPRQPAAAPKVVSIPNPRPAPEGAKPVEFVCAFNKLYPLELDVLRKDAENKVKSVIARRTVKKDPQHGVDPADFKKYYEKFKFPTNRFFDVSYYVSGDRYPRIRLTPEEPRGATEDELLRPGSRIRRMIDPLDPRKYYARFHVLPDSYDIYLTARRLLANKGMLAGWEPQSENWIYTSYVPGGVELGPPRPKPPPSKAPTKPANVID